MSEPKYYAPKVIQWHSIRYGKTCTVPEGYPSDGATFAEDIYSDSWWIHDKLCDTGKWDDGTLCTNWQASMTLRDILLAEGRWVRAHRWFLPTLLFGGGKCRDNGIFKLKEKR